MRLDEIIIFFNSFRAKFSKYAPLLLKRDIYCVARQQFESLFLSFRKVWVWKKSSKSVTDETRKEEKRVEIKTKKKKGRNILVLYQITTGMKGFVVFPVLLWKILHQLVLAFSLKYVSFLSLHFFFYYEYFPHTLK